MPADAGKMPALPIRENNPSVFEGHEIMPPFRFHPSATSSLRPCAISGGTALDAADIARAGFAYGLEVKEFWDEESVRYRCIPDTVAAGRIEWRKHVLQKLAERGIAQQAVRDVLLTGERIRHYEDDKPFPRALLLGYVDLRPLHVVAACDEAGGQAFVITAYEPSLEIFEPDYRTKRKP